MSAIIPFRFDDHAIRTVVDDNGEVWFVGKDVAVVLGYADTVNALKQHCRGVVKRHPIVDSLGRQQETRIISEPDLFRLVVNSKLPTAERFERWVFEDVLPSIRKTGAYSVPGAVAALPASTQDRVSAILLIGEAIAKVPGVKIGIAMAATLTCIQENTGLTVETLRRTLPAAADPICSLNATQLGKLLGRSAKSTNRLLAELGLQFRNERDEWELTEAGKTWAEAMPYSRNGHSGYQILWSPAVAEHMKEMV
ncbi:MAG: Bro-N domain-containing protein [Rhodocyclaceae bacterium]|nr:Bro-N domain-containing protein [Rhodocyclaceae bacterium]